MADRTGFLAFIRNSMGINTTVLPDNSTDIDTALALAIEIAYLPTKKASPLIYDLSVYNLAGSNLVEFANDQTGLTYFAALRTQFGINGFMPGVISSAGDEGTSSSTLNPDFMKGLTMADLQYIKTPWGRAYMSYAQRIGAVWGIS